MEIWEFNASDPSDVFVNPNQGDQFDNDDVDLAEALVRESIQNSSDASINGSPVKVRFDLTTIDGERAAQNARALTAFTASSSGVRSTLFWAK